MTALTRLSDQQRTDRDLTEDALMRQLTDVAALLGYAWIHLRPARTQHGWRTPVSGPLGKGWPDVVLVNPLKRRTIAVELKRELAPGPGPDQQYVHRILAEAGWDVRVLRPSGLDELIKDLAR